MEFNGLSWFLCAFGGIGRGGEVAMAKSVLGIIGGSGIYD
jgi:hypothetical protein